ncbi:MAG: hypothetical protein CMQ58_04000 [Gammaproteobacteria bacterium]|nr:hypothetical protein [Gammaproteobacteria bacterium]|tara:strand:- start:737 stop:1378 length:642 start_codon:yes stop_codon:yes gene_type:complete
MKYLVLGATGLVGSKIIEKLDPKNEVVAFCRRDFDFPSHVKKNIVNFEEDFDLPIVDHLFICLGFPVELLDLVIMRKSVKKLFKKVDLDLVTQVAKKAKQIGIKNVSVISSVAASDKSLNYYLKIKGQMENNLRELGFDQLNIIQPSHMLGEREKPIGHDVKLFEDITNITGNFLFGPLAKFKNVEAEKIATLMIRKSTEGSNGVNFYSRLDI